MGVAPAAAVAMSAFLLLLAPPPAGWGFRDTRTRAEERANVPADETGQEDAEARRTRKIIEEARDEHLIDEWDGSIAKAIDKMDGGDFLNKDEKRATSYFSVM